MYPKTLIRLFFLVFLLHFYEISGSVCLFDMDYHIEKFFKVILTESEIGYTLYGDKPLSTYDPPKESCLKLGSKAHKDLITVLFFKQILSCDRKNTDSNYFLRYGDQGDFLLTVINRKAFLKVVKENLTFFQDRFGVEVTPKSFFDHIIDPKVNLRNLFKNNRAALGILLGYGVKNALIFERFQKLTDAIHNANYVLPPFALYKIDSDWIKAFEKMGVSCALSINCRSVGSQLSYIESALDCSAKKLPKSKPFIRFCYLKKDDQSDLLINHYQRVHQKIDHVLRNKDLKGEFFDKFRSINLDKMMIDRQLDLKDFYQAIAQNLIERFSLFDPKKINLFIKGIELARKNQGKQFIAAKNKGKGFDYLLSIFSQSDYRHHEFENDINAFFVKNVNTVEVVPNKIVYQVLQQGKGEQITQKTKKAYFKYCIRNLSNHRLAGTFVFDTPKEVDLSNVFSGFAYGVLGMKVGERRKIFIDSEFAYGKKTLPQYRLGFIVDVELTAIKSCMEMDQFPPLFPTQLMYLKNLKIVNNLDELERVQDDLMIYCGIVTWNFYHYFNIDFDLLIKELQDSKLSSSNLEHMINIYYSLYLKLP